jgi:AAA ATPase domain
MGVRQRFNPPVVDMGDFDHINSQSNAPRDEDSRDPRVSRDIQGRSCPNDGGSEQPSGGMSWESPDIFVGRGKELSSVVCCIKAAQLGHGGVTLIAGDPGIGKTRLAREAAKDAMRRGMRVLWGRCWGAEGTPSFWPWTQIVRSYARDVSRDDCVAAMTLGAADIIRVIPEIRDLLPVSAIPSQDDNPAARFRFFDNFSVFLKRIADQIPTLMVLDDLQDADDGSLLLLQFIANDIIDSNLAFVGTYRDTRVEPGTVLSRVLTAVSRHSWAQQSVLCGLGQDDGVKLLEFITGGIFPKSLAAAIHHQSNGNPFYLREIGTLLARDGRLPIRAASERPFVLPQTVREMIADQLCVLSFNCQRILSSASVIGNDFDETLLAELCNTDAAEVASHLGSAVAKRIVVRSPRRWYRFTHAIVREAIYESLPIEERVTLHERIASTLDGRLDTGSDSLNSVVAHHYFMALPTGNVDDMVRSAMRAGHEAQMRLAYEDAIIHFQRVLGQPSGAIDDQTRCDLLLALGECQAGAGCWQESRSTFARAATAARTLRNPRSLAQAAIGYKGMMGATTPADMDAVTLLRESADILSKLEDRAIADDARLLVRVLSALSRSLYFANVPEEMTQHSKTALVAALNLGDEELVLVALEARVTSLWRPCALGELLPIANELLGRSLRLGMKEFAFNARLYRRYCFLTQGDIAASHQELCHAERLGRETGNVRYSWHAPMIRAAMALSRGGFDESEELSERARYLGGRLHDSSPNHNYMVQSFQRARLRGAFGGLETAMVAAQEKYPDILGYRAALALLFAHHGQADRARIILKGLATNSYSDVPMDNLTLWVLGVIAEAVSICGEPQWVLPLYEKLKPFDAFNIVMSWGSVFDGAVSHYLGVLAQALGDVDAATTHFECAIRANGSIDCAPLLARTQCHYATMLLEDGRSESVARGLRHLYGAIDVFGRLGMVGYLERSRKVLEVAVGGGHLDERTRREMPSTTSSRPRSETGEFVFRREVEFWTVAFEYRVIRLRHSRGLAMLALLLQRPDTEVHVLDLVGARSGPLEPNASDEKRLGGKSGTPGVDLHGDAGPLLDSRARSEYRRRAEELRSELAEARQFNDLGRVSALSEQMQFIEEELKRAFGRGGQSRVAASFCERARVNVRNNLSTALKILKRSDHGLGRHLDGALRTGTFCSYRPERPVPWAF